LLASDAAQTDVPSTIRGATLRSTNSSDACERNLHPIIIHEHHACIDQLLTGDLRIREFLHDLAWDDGKH
jgi:hypothetical protein